MPDITLRTENPEGDDRAFLRQLFATLDEVQPLLQAGPMADQLIDMQLNGREQQYRAGYPNAAFELILDGDQPIGRLVTDRSGEAWSLVDIAILPEHRGRGIGGRLVQQLLDDAREAGRRVDASVRTENPARFLWTRLGFEVLDEGPVYWTLQYRP